MSSSEKNGSLPILSQVFGFVSIEDFNPFILFSHYKNSGLPIDALQTAIYDGVVDAYVSWDSKKHPFTFGAYCYWCCRAHIKKLSHRVQRSLQREISIDFNGQHEIADNSEQVKLESTEFPELLGLDIPQFFRGLFRHTFNKKNDPSGKCETAMYFRYCCGKRWTEIAKIMGYTTRSAAQNHNRLGTKLLREFLGSEKGRQTVRLLLKAQSIELSEDAEKALFEFVG